MARSMTSMLKLAIGIAFAVVALAFSNFEVATAYLCQGQGAAVNSPRIGVSRHGTLYFSAQIHDQTAGRFVVLARIRPSRSPAFVSTAGAATSRPLSG